MNGKFRISSSVEERFNNLFIPVTESGCWIWLGALNEGGYGVFRVSNEWLLDYPGVNTTLNKSRHVQVQAHRVSYALIFGKISPDLTLDHLCRVRCCVNPYHVEEVTARENTLRGFSSSAIAMRRNCCVRGHPYDSANLYFYRGQRMCRECMRGAVRKMRARRKNISSVS